MEQKKYKVLGVMSGTSLDGIDLAYINFSKDNVWSYSIEETETVSYSEFWTYKLTHLVDCNIEELKVLDKNYTIYLVSIISDFISKHNLKDIDAVCSHGHTALHKPEIGLTYQIGNLPQLAILLNQKVVCDFRIQDVQLGGQGAPLV
ncbi:anhydro-N-acetylmuramic acid kinase, partial [Aurantibacter sp.]|uniref:anhydro-N-acetylmuramic acid kinase n=1 Tax=Aurantibacter sp. TaxID=2807103 RepID=UPI0035C7D111